MIGRVLIAVFERETDILQATRSARTEGLDVVDVFTPHAIHGMDRALGLRPSRIPWVCFLLAVFGSVTMMAFQYWASAVDWPINVGGKPWNSWPAFTPVVFEVAVLSSGVGTVLFFIAWSGLRPGRQSPVSDLGVTDDRYALVIRLPGGASDRSALESFFARFHAVSIEERDMEREVS